MTLLFVPLEDAARTILPLQQRARKTRAALLHTVERLVADESEAAVTTTRVAAEAAVSVGAVYRYFPDREALLLDAYDATVARIVAHCSAALDALPDGMGREDAARALLGAYLEAALAIPAHSGLLRAMRRIRPVEADFDANEDRVASGILTPFLARFVPEAADAPPDRLHFLNVLLGSLVDLYLVTEGEAARTRLRADIEAHMLLALERAAG
ncbi:MAG: TetR/AcrR family transcriptional regulator [Mesorhizobium sp.]|nr:TetR/AcrR family transcriptional regulator [Mesorhizobium sp.]